MKTKKKHQKNLTRGPELFRAPQDPGPGTMYPLNPPFVGPAYRMHRFIPRSRRVVASAAIFIALFYKRVIGAK